MKIAVAQTRPAAGDIGENLGAHLRLTDIALGCGATLIVFPELSLTGYEPAFAQELAIEVQDVRFDVLQALAERSGATIVAGAPVRATTGIHIGAIVFRAGAPRNVISKAWLHPDEMAFFVSGRNETRLIDSTSRVALGICYEISVPEHLEECRTAGASTYIASVAKFGRAIENTHKRLAEIAVSLSVPVAMANCIGNCDGEFCAGQSAVWNRHGVRLAALDDVHEGVIVFDRDSDECEVLTVDGSGGAAGDAPSPRSGECARA